LPLSTIREAMQLQRSDQESSSLFSLSEELREHIVGFAVATVDQFWTLSAVCKRWHSRSRLADFVYEDVRMSLEKWKRCLTAMTTLTINARSITLSQTNVPYLPVSNAEAVIVHKCFQADEIRLWYCGGDHHTMLWTHAAGLNSAIQVVPTLLTLGLSNATLKWSDMRLLWQHLTHGSFPALQTLFLGGVQCTDLRAATAAAAFVPNEPDEAAALPRSLRVCELTYVSAELLTQLQALLGGTNWQQLQRMVVDFILSSGAACADAAVSSSTTTTASSTVWDAAAAQQLEQHLYGSSTSNAAALTTANSAVVAADLRRVVRYTSLTQTSYQLVRCNECHIQERTPLRIRWFDRLDAHMLNSEYCIVMISVCFMLLLTVTQVRYVLPRQRQEDASTRCCTQCLHTCSSLAAALSAHSSCQL
jgi:hypothetical protein